VSGEDLRRALETIERSAEAQRQLVDDLLDMSQMLAGRMRLNVHEAEVAPVVRAAVEVVRPMAEAKRVALELSVGRVPRARIDPARVQQVVWNLLSNAVKFTPEGGRVAVRLRQVDGAAELDVSDNGAGSARRSCRTCSTGSGRRTRARRVRRVGWAGTGDHAATRGNARRDDRGGQRREGRGATFRVRLPLPEGADGVSAGEDGNGRGWCGCRGRFVPSPVLRGVRALVVEDEDHTRTVIRWLLEQCGADVTAVGSASDALAALRARRQQGNGKRYDVLVSDIGLPEEDGTSCCGARGRWSGRRTN
jgi:CheY-like chemotaxis protein